jgi:hypothetical protein
LLELTIPEREALTQPSAEVREVREAAIWEVTS